MIFIKSLAIFYEAGKKIKQRLKPQFLFSSPITRLSKPSGKNSEEDVETEGWVTEILGLTFLRKDGRQRQS